MMYSSTCFLGWIGTISNTDPAQDLTTAGEDLDDPQ